MAELAPEGARENELAERVVERAWKLRRARRMEERLTWLHYVDNHSAQIKVEELDAEKRRILSDNISAELVGHQRCIANLDRHEAHLERGFYKAMHELRDLRKEREESLDWLIANAEREGKRAAAASGSAKRSQSGAGTPTLQEEIELFSARKAKEAAGIRAAISGQKAGACGNDGAEKRDAERPRLGVTPQSGATRKGEESDGTRGREGEGDSAKRSQFGAAVPASERAETPPHRMAQAAS